MRWNSSKHTVAWLVLSAGLLAAVQPAAAADLRGRIIHSGSGSGLYLVFGFRLHLGNPVAGLDARSVPGEYEIPGVAENSSYALFAYRDLNGNLLPGIGEPFGWFGTPFPNLVHVGTQDVENLDIVLREQAFVSEIRGQVIFNGFQRGRIWLIPHFGRVFTPSQIAGTPWTLDTTGSEYRIFVFAPANYYISAWVDVNANLLPDEGEPRGTIGSSVPITGPGQVSTGNDLIVFDPSVAVENVSWSQIKGLYNR